MEAYSVLLIGADATITCNQNETRSGNCYQLLPILALYQIAAVNTAIWYFDLSTGALAYLTIPVHVHTKFVLYHCMGPVIQFIFLIVTVQKKVMHYALCANFRPKQKRKKGKRKTKNWSKQEKAKRDCLLSLLYLAWNAMLRICSITNNSWHFDEIAVLLSL